MKKDRLTARRHTAHAHYLPGYSEGGPWKTCVFNVGTDETPPGFKEYPYPQDECLHPNPYFFTWEEGRALMDYHILIIEHGSGFLESQAAGRRMLRAGDAFIPFPGDWHRYRPGNKTGWTSWWIGLRGEYAQHLMSTFFSPERPVIPLHDCGKTISLFRQIGELLQGNPERHQGRVAALAARLIDDLQHCAKSLHETARQDRIGKAKLTLLSRSQEEVDLEVLARELGISYSSFRREFKRETGIPPRQYLLGIRINRAKALLTGTDRTAADISNAIGFSSPGYFGRYFKQITGMSPRRFRESTRAERGS